jgi:hypothetical protein
MKIEEDLSGRELLKELTRIEQEARALRVRAEQVVARLTVANQNQTPRQS